MSRAHLPDGRPVSRRRRTLMEEAERRSKSRPVLPGPARRRSSGEFAHWLILVSFTAAIAGIILVWPQHIVAAFPAAARLYDKVGIEVNVVGFDIENIRSRLLHSGGEPTLKIDGFVSNVSGAARKVPHLRFTLRDQAGQNIYAWTAEVSERPLEAGVRIPFSTEVPAPPQAAEQVEIRFGKLDDVTVDATTP